MSDLIERLRDKKRLRAAHGLTGWGLAEEALLVQAASEIERLTAALQHEADCVEAAKAEIERLTAERDKARAERDALADVLPGYYYMDPPDGGSVPLGEQVRRMAVDAARYRWLRGDSCPNHSSRWTQWEVRCWKAPFWTGDLRRADLDDAIDAAIDAARGKE